MPPLPRLNPHCSYPIAHSAPAITRLIYIYIELINYVQQTRVTTFILVTFPFVQGHSTCTTPVDRYYPHIKTCIQVSLTILTLPYHLSLNTPLEIHANLEPHSILFHSLPISFHPPNTGIRLLPAFTFASQTSSTFSTCSTYPAYRLIWTPSRFIKSTNF